MIFQQNQLKVASSPYLRQHAGNPVWWQEWKPEVLEHARRENKPLFVSVGYATCHWCHVMASESFEDTAAAAFLNEHFVSVKVDREQRPDIDQYLMAFIHAQGRQGGWPLNCFLTPDLTPFLALTYVPPQPRYGLPGFCDLLGNVLDHYRRSKGRFEAFELPMEPIPSGGEEDVVGMIKRAFDPVHGGFGDGTKFPPHGTLLFMLYEYAGSQNREVRHMLERTLDSMIRRGLHDHLQGGFFRYCVDREWSIPHFEKMLYDQAMLLWVFSLAYAAFGNESIRQAAVKIQECLEATFEENGLYVSGHDADTDHEEGLTYLWSRDEVARVLTSLELDRFTAVYPLSAQGNFEGGNHLYRVGDEDLRDIEAKLLRTRKARRQPSVDRKIITSWNCLAGIGFIHAYRYAGSADALDKAERLAVELLRRHCIDGKLAHSSFDGQLQQQEFLQDYAGLLLFLTYLHEETGRYKDELALFAGKVKEFQKADGWIESFNDDFIPVPAASFDHPVPSSIALAEMALLRVDILAGRPVARRSLGVPLQSDFYNIAVLLANGDFHTIETPQKIAWDTLPFNSLQRRGDHASDCYRGACRTL